jgi:adenylate cyclase
LVFRLTHVAVGYYFSGAYGDAVEAAEHAIRSFPEYPVPYRWLAAALGQLGRTQQAEEVLEKATAIAPAMFDVYDRRRPPWVRQEDHAHILEGLRKAGWREE